MEFKIFERQIQDGLWTPPGSKDHNTYVDSLKNQVGRKLEESSDEALAALASAGIGAAAGTATALIIKRRVCKRRFPNDEKRYKACVQGNLFSKKNKPEYQQEPKK